MRKLLLLSLFAVNAHAATFGEAIEGMRTGLRYTRAAWTDQFAIISIGQVLRRASRPEDGQIILLPSLLICAAHDNIGRCEPYLPNGLDMRQEDWQVWTP